MTTLCRKLPFTVKPTKTNRSLCLAWDISSPPSEWEAWALVQSDEHFDSKLCDRDTLKEHHDEAVRRGAAIIKVGDTFDVMQGPGDRRACKSALRDEYAVAEYFDAVTNDAEDFYSPYAQNIVAIGEGNHEDAVKRHYGVNLIKRLAKDLRDAGGETRAMGYDFWVRFMFNRGTQRVSKDGYFFHGSGGGGPVTKDQIQASRQFERIGQVDLICTGHTHDSWSDKQPREQLDHLGEPSIRLARYLKIGNYKGRGSWEVTKGMPHKPIGAHWLRFFFKGGTVQMEIRETEPVA